MTTIASASLTPLAFTKASDASAKAAASAAAGFGTVSMQQVQDIEQKLVALLLSNIGSRADVDGHPSMADAGKPALREPALAQLMRAAHQGASPAQPKMTPEAVLLMLAMQLSETVTLENSRNLATQLELMKARLAARSASAAELSEAIKLAQALADAAMGDVGLAEGELAAAMEALKKANAEVARLEQALADAPEDEKEAIRAQLEAAKAHAAVQLGHVDVAQGKLNEALATLNSALKDLEAFKAAADQLDPSRSVSARGDEKALTNGSFLSLLLASLQEIIDTANINKLKEDTKFLREVLKLREAENLRRSEEYQAELEKAEQAQKKMGCIGKIVGWVITVVAVVAAPNVATAVKAYLDQLALSSEERQGERSMYGTPGRSRGQKAFDNRTDAPSGTVPERTVSVKDFNRYLVDSGFRSREAGQVARDITHSPQPADEGAEVRDAFAQYHASRSSGSESLVSALRRQGTFVKADGRSEAERQAAAVETGRVTSQPRSSQTARTMPDTVSSLFSSAAISVMRPSQSDAVKSFRTPLHLSINGAGNGSIRRRDSVESLDSDARSEDSSIGRARHSPSSDNGEFDFNDVGTTGSESGPPSPSDNMAIQKSEAQYPGVGDFFTYVKPQTGMRYHFGSEVGSDDPAQDREITEVLVADHGKMDNSPLTLGGQNTLEALRKLQPIEESTRSGSTLQATSSWPQL